jgi:REP element-mobilizing transposase RayT
MNAFHTLFVHVVFQTQQHQPLIEQEYKVLLNEFFSEQISADGYSVLTFCLMRDHVHVVLEYHIHLSLEEIVDQLKTASRNWVAHKSAGLSFEWSTDFYAISFGHADLDSVFKILRKQQDYHLKASFADELNDLLDYAEFPF